MNVLLPTWPQQVRTAKQRSETQAHNRNARYIKALRDGYLVLRTGVRNGHLGAQAALHAHLETVRTARAVVAACKYTDQRNYTSHSHCARV
jgi:hypothetical protein